MWQLVSGISSKFADDHKCSAYFARLSLLNALLRVLSAIGERFSSTELSRLLCSSSSAWSGELITFDVVVNLAGFTRKQKKTAGCTIQGVMIYVTCMCKERDGYQRGINFQYMYIVMLPYQNGTSRSRSTHPISVTSHISIPQGGKIYIYIYIYIYMY